MAVNADAINVDEGETQSELLDGRLLVFQRVVAQVEIAVAMVCLGPSWCAAAMTDLNDDKAQLRHLHLLAVSGKGVRDAFGLRSGVDVGNDRVLLGLIKIEWQPHVAVKIGDAISSLDG